MLMYLSPVVYMANFVPEERWGLPLRELYYYNPLACIFGAVQWSLLGGEPPPTGPLVSLALFVIGSLFLSHWVYARLKPAFTKSF